MSAEAYVHNLTLFFSNPCLSIITTFCKATLLLHSQNSSSVLYCTLSWSKSYPHVHYTSLVLSLLSWMNVQNLYNFDLLLDSFLCWFKSAAMVLCLYCVNAFLMSMIYVPLINTASSMVSLLLWHIVQIS